MRSVSAIQSSAIRLVDYSQLSGLLFCPDDGAKLDCLPPSIECGACKRRFHIYEDGVADLLPRRRNTAPDERNARYWNDYAQEFARPYTPNPKAMAWGALEVSDSKWRRKRLRQVQAVRPLVTNPKLSKTHVLCDIAAGAGNYTLAYAPLFRAVLHCDLSVDNLSYAARKAERLGIRNIFFLRVDYFSAPFAKAVDRLICFDTLVRGEKHEIALLKTIRRALKPDGSALVDFHNWWHNPLRRLGLLPQNFGQNQSYRRKSAEALLNKGGISRFEFFPFHQELDAGQRPHPVLSRALPSTRLLYRFQGETLAPVVRTDGQDSKFEEFHVAKL